MLDFERVIVVGKDTPSDIVRDLQDRIDTLEAEYDDLCHQTSEETSKLASQLVELDASIAPRLDEAKQEGIDEVWDELEYLVETAFRILGENVRGSMQFFSYPQATALADKLESADTEKDRKINELEAQVETLEEKVSDLEHDIDMAKEDSTYAMVVSLLDQRSALINRVKMLELEALGQMTIPEVTASLNFTDGRVPPPVMSFIQATNTWTEAASDPKAVSKDILSGHIPDDPLAASSVLAARIGFLISSMGLLSEGKHQLVVLISNLLTVIERMAASYGSS